MSWCLTPQNYELVLDTAKFVFDKWLVLYDTSYTYKYVFDFELVLHDTANTYKYAFDYKLVLHDTAYNT